MCFFVTSFSHHIAKVCMTFIGIFSFELFFLVQVFEDIKEISGSICQREYTHITRLKRQDFYQSKQVS